MLFNPDFDPMAPVKRWTPGRKADLVAAVDCGDILYSTALRVHGISSDEFSAWRSALERAGYKALRVTVKASA